MGLVSKVGRLTGSPKSQNPAGPGAIAAAGLLLLTDPGAGTDAGTIERGNCAVSNFAQIADQQPAT